MVRQQRIAERSIKSVSAHQANRLGTEHQFWLRSLLYGPGAKVLSGSGL